MASVYEVRWSAAKKLWSEIAELCDDGRFEVRYSGMMGEVVIDEQGGFSGQGGISWKPKGNSTFVVMDRSVELDNGIRDTVAAYREHTLGQVTVSKLLDLQTALTMVRTFPKKDEV